MTKKNDLLWAYSGFIALAISGLLMNLVVAKLLGTEGLGVFNQVFAIYIVASQLAVGGVQFSVLKSVASSPVDKLAQSSHIQAGVCVAGLLGLVVAFALLALEKTFGKIFSSPGVEANIIYIAIAVVFFALNKVLLAGLNGQERIKAFSLLQACRALLIVMSLGFIASQGWQDKTGAAFLIAEVFVAIGAALTLQQNLLVRWHLKNLNLLIHHFKFGMKSIGSGLLIDLNTRVDVIMLGAYLNDLSVGIYSLPAILAEGAYQALIVLRNLVNPKIAHLASINRRDEIQALFRSLIVKVYAGLIFIAVGAVVFLYLVLSYYIPSDTAMTQVILLGILCTGIVLASPFSPFENMLVYSGRPFYQTFYNALLVLTNIGLNFIFIPLYGVYGAAIATGLTYILSAVYLVLILRICKYELI